jgi:hypothetical protein
MDTPMNGLTEPTAHKHDLKETASERSVSLNQGMGKPAQDGLDLTLADALKTHFQGRISAIRMHSSLGVYEVLPGHCPMTLTLESGPIQIRLTAPQKDTAQAIQEQEPVGQQPTAPTDGGPNAAAPQASTPDTNAATDELARTPTTLPPSFDPDPDWTGPQIHQFFVEEGLFVIDGWQARLLARHIQSA